MRANNKGNTIGRRIGRQSRQNYIRSLLGYNSIAVGIGEKKIGYCMAATPINTLT